MKKFIIVWMHPITGKIVSERTLYDIDGAKSFADEKKKQGFIVAVNP